VAVQITVPDLLYTMEAEEVNFSDSIHAYGLTKSSDGGAPVELTP